MAAVLLYVWFSFFFSSRRRHTRCSRDWSSDVCSSDLPPPSAQHREPPTPTDHEPLLYEVEDQARNPEVFLGWAAPGRESWPGPSPPVRRSADPAGSSLAVGPFAGCW